MFNKPLQQKYGRPRKLNLPVHQYAISIQLGEKVELIAKTPELWSHHWSVMCGVFSLGTITWCGLRLTNTILDN